MLKIRLAVSGRGYHHSTDLPEFLELPEGATLDEALAAIGELLPPEGQLARSALVAVSGRHVGTVGSHPPQLLQPGDELVVIAPVAGG